MNEKAMYVLPPKPPSEKEQISVMWDILANHLPHCLQDVYDRIHWVDRKLNFILGFMGLVLALLGVLIARG